MAIKQNEKKLHGSNFFCWNFVIFCLDFCDFFLEIYNISVDFCNHSLYNNFGGWGKPVEIFFASFWTFIIKKRTFIIDFWTFLIFCWTFITEIPLHALFYKAFEPRKI